ncbi:MAG: RnfABCDGE type electron transport complex subunit B [Clostridia bacterium]|nr:RnfABCDGE type electron transport complex subunit B [Clostridia bacterium]
MNEIILPVIIVAGIGLLAGLLLAVLSKIMAVPVDEKEEAITEVLPGANCGACGFSGCQGYAGALSKGETKDTGLCAPGGSEVSAKIAEIMGLAASTITPMAAVVRCMGTDACAEKKMEYVGVDSCKMASQLFGGDKTCIYGCLGLGDCQRECPYDAINICNGVAIVSPELCRACKKCVAVCPKNLIELMPKSETKAAVLCRNHDKGALTRKECTAGCIGCTKCVKTCPEEAISMDNLCAIVDYNKCTGCGKCTEACPNNTIKLLNKN